MPADAEELHLSPDAAELLARLPVDRTARGNTVLRAELVWDEDRYLAARNELLDAGLAQAWRGRGGSLRRIDEAQEALAGVPDEEAEAEFQAEKDLYEPMSAVIAGAWARDARLDNSVVAIVGHQGKKRTGGKWSRPDIVLVAVNTFPLVPGRHLSVVTFEVKRGAALDVTAVYEALAHRRAATHAIVLVHAPVSDEVLDVVEAEAARHGIGLIVAEDPTNFETWDTRVDAQRVAPEPWNLNSFLTVQLPQEERDAVAALIG